MISHLARGLAILGERWWSGPWITQAQGPVDLWVRRALRAALTMVAFRIACASPWLFAAAVLVVVVRALRAATKAAKGEQKPTAKASQKAPDAGTGELDEDQFLTFIWDALGDAKAIHLTTLAGALTEATGTGWDGPAVRAACQTHRIPVRPKVRDLGGDRVSSGVHRDDLPPLPQPLPEGVHGGPGGGYVAGQGGNATALPGTHATTPTPKTRRIGDLRITSIEDPENPHRTHVQVADPTRKKARR